MSTTQVVIKMIRVILKNTKEIFLLFLNMDLSNFLKKKNITRIDTITSNEYAELINNELEEEKLFD